MNEITRLAVPDIHCQHCKESIEAAVGALDGVSSVEVDVPGRIVTAVHDPARTPAGRIAAEVEDQGYEVAAREQVP